MSVHRSDFNMDSALSGITHVIGYGAVTLNILLQAARADLAVDTSDNQEYIQCGVIERCNARTEFCDDSQVFLKCMPCADGPCHPSQGSYKTNCLRLCPNCNDCVFPFPDFQFPVEDTQHGEDRTEQHSILTQTATQIIPAESSTEDAVPLHVIVPVVVLLAVAVLSMFLVLVCRKRLRKQRRKQRRATDPEPGETAEVNELQNMGSNTGNGSEGGLSTINARPEASSTSHSNRNSIQDDTAQNPAAAAIEGPDDPIVGTSATTSSISNNNYNSITIEHEPVQETQEGDFSTTSSSHASLVFLSRHEGDTGVDAIDPQEPLLGANQSGRSRSTQDVSLGQLSVAHCEELES